MAPQKTGVNFINTIPENNSLHVMNYEYLYNGHGIGIGDFNNDGFEDIFISGNAVPNKLFLNKKERKVSISRCYKKGRRCRQWHLEHRCMCCRCKWRWAYGYLCLPFR